MLPPSEDIKDILVSSAVGVGAFNATSGWSVVISEMPDTPDTCILISDTGGLPANPRYSYEKPSVQILVRGAKEGYLSAYAKMEDIKDALNGLNNEEWNSTRYIQIIATSETIYLGRDDKQRPRFSINFLCHRTEAIS